MSNTGNACAITMIKNAKVMIKCLTIIQIDLEFRNVGFDARKSKGFKIKPRKVNLKQDQNLCVSQQGMETNQAHFKNCLLSKSCTETTVTTLNCQQF